MINRILTLVLSLLLSPPGWEKHPSFIVLESSIFFNPPCPASLSQFTMKFKNSSRVILRWVLSQLILESELTGPNLLCPCCSRIYFWTMALIVGILLFYWQYFLSVNIPFFYIIFALFFSLQNSSLSTGLLIPILSFYNKIIHSHGCSILFNSQIKIFIFRSV